MLSWENSLGHLIGVHSESENKMKTDLKLGYEFELAWNESQVEDLHGDEQLVRQELRHGKRL